MSEEVCKNCMNGYKKQQNRVYCENKNREMNDLETCILFFPKILNGIHQVHPDFISHILFVIYKAWQTKDFCMSIQSNIEKLILNKEHDEHISSVIKEIQDFIVSRSQIVLYSDEYYINAIAMIKSNLIGENLSNTKENLEKFLSTEIKQDLHSIFSKIKEKFKFKDE